MVLSIAGWYGILTEILKTDSLSFSLFISVLDEKEKFEPTVFRDTIVQGLNEAGSDLEAIAKFLDATGSRLDYRRYADTLFDILVAGSMLGNLQCTWYRILMISLASFKMLVFPLQNGNYKLYYNFPYLDTCCISYHSIVYCL